MVFNKIGVEGATAMGTTLFLKKHSTLMYLNLSNCMVGSPGCVWLFRCLGANSSLTEIKFVGNKISDDHVTATVKALKINTPFSILVLAIVRLGPGMCGPQSLSATYQSLRSFKFLAATRPETTAPQQQTLHARRTIRCLIFK